MFQSSPMNWFFYLLVLLFTLILLFNSLNFKMIYMNLNFKKYFMKKIKYVK